MLSALIVFGRFLQKALAFPSRICRHFELSALRCGYFAIILSQVSVGGSEHNPQAVRLIVGAIAFAKLMSSSRLSTTSTHSPTS